MEITHVKIFPVQEDKLKAFVSIVFDNCFMVNDIKIIQGKDGLFLSMPSRRKKTGEFKDVAHPLNSATRLMLEERVLDEYRRDVDDTTPRRPDVEESAADPQTESRGHGTDDGAGSATPGVVSNGSRPPGTAVGLKPTDTLRPQEANGTEPPAASGGGGGSDGTHEGSREPSLKEVEEKILRDSFWTRPPEGSD